MDVAAIIRRLLKGDPILDYFIGEHVLPFILQLLELPVYSRATRLWKYQNLHCGIDPIALIVEDFKDDKYVLGRVAILKEMGRAAYQIPYENRFMHAFERKHIEKKAQAELGETNVAGLHTCQVCGFETLLAYEDVEEDDPANPTCAWQQTWKVECLYCSFEIDNRLENPSNYALPLPDYWTSEVIWSKDID